MENAPKNREWVKTAAIIFLSVLLVLTFFSNTIMNRMLPEVSTVEVMNGSITAKVRVSGKVSAVGINEVKADGTRTVAAVKAKVGQEVSAGDILFVMGEAESEEIENAEEIRDSAYYANERAKVSYPTNTAANQAIWRAECELEDAKNLMEAAERELYSAGTNAKVLLAKEEMKQAQEEYSYAQNVTADAQNAYNEARGNAERLQNDLEIARISGDDPARIQELEVQLVGAEYEETLRDREYASAENDEANAFSNYEDKKAKYEAALSTLESTLKSAYDIAVSRYNSAQSAYNSACDSYAVSTESFNQSYAQAQINADEAQHTLDKRQKKVDNLKGDGEDVNVYAKVSGTVQSISCTSGDKVVKDSVMCTIEVPDMGYTMQGTVTKDQADRLKVGDVGTDQYQWGKPIEGTIRSIEKDPKDPMGKKILTFDLNGNVEIGKDLTLSVGQKSASYDYIVPKSAVKSDNNGNFVLVITSKSNALGNRYFAKRVAVEILAEDDSNRAISGDIDYGDFIITNSSTKVNSGDQIKLADS